MRSKEDIVKDMEAFEGSKRTNAYKKLKAELKSVEENTSSSFPSPKEGLGDKVEKVIKATGLDKLAPKDCGCEERKQLLNEFGVKARFVLNNIFGTSKLKELSESDYKYLCEKFKDGLPDSIGTNDQIRYNEIYFRVSGIQKRKTSCSSCVKKVVLALYELHSQYKNGQQK